MPPNVRGGAELRRFIARAKAARSQGVKYVEVGFFSSARYSPVTQGRRGGRRRQAIPVTNVAAWNEFGTRNRDGSVHTPERPFMRNAIREAPDKLRPVARERINPRTMVVDRATGEALGQVMQGAIQESIIDLKRPPNAPSTIKLKGSDNPLLDEAVMLGAVTYKVR